MVGTIGGGALFLDQRHVARAEYEQFAGRVEASPALMQLGAAIDARRQVRCNHLRGPKHANCVFLRARTYEALRRG